MSDELTAPAPSGRMAFVRRDRALPYRETSAIDWVLVPGVAFDREGRRLGYGGGFYDRLLSLVGRVAPRVAGAYALQLTDGVPSAPHDARIDTLVTPAQTLVIGDGRE